MSENRLLIICSDAGTSDIIHMVAEKRSYAILRVHSLEDIQKDLQAFRPTLIVLEQNFADLDGILLLNYLANLNCKAQLIIVGIDDLKLSLSLRYISEVKGIKLLGVLSEPIVPEDLEKLFIYSKQNVSAEINARQILRAIEENYFVMHYQPKILLSSKKLWGFEALIRLQPPYENLIYPGHFIPASEESGLIVPLTHWIIKKVFENCHIFHQKNSDLKFAINISSVSLNDPVFPDEILKIAKTYNVDPNLICFEITESGVSHQSDIILEVLTRLRLMGFALSIDDFGTGYSSIVELQRLPFTELKIDQRFVSELNDNNAAQIIVRSIIELGHNLGLELVAEGVEDIKILERLKALNCDIAQGFFISNGLSLEDILEWYDNHIDAKLIWHIDRRIPNND